MKDLDIEMLSAYLDQELAPDEARAIKLRLDDEDDLRMIYRQMQSNTESIRRSIQRIDDMPLSPKLSALMVNIDGIAIIASKPRKVPLRLFDGLLGICRSIEARFTWSLNAVAAILLIVAVSFFFTGSSTQNKLMDLSVGDSLGVLSAAFVRPSSGRNHITIEGVTITQKFAFIRKDGSLCKRYSASNVEREIHAVACYQGHRWLIAVTEAAASSFSHSPEELYQPASAGSDSLVDAYIQRHIDNIPLSSLEEQQQLKRIFLK